MIIEILKRTPLWVFPLFAALLYLGYTQSRTRSMPLARVLVLPVVMSAFSLYGVLSGFGGHAEALSAWAVGILGAASAFAAMGFGRSATYSPQEKRFTIPGSWIPMALILVIFFARYAINVSLGMNPALRDAVPFAIAAGALYGASSGFFAGRALGILRRTRATA